MEPSSQRPIAEQNAHAPLEQSAVAGGAGPGEITGRAAAARPARSRFRQLLTATAVAVGLAAAIFFGSGPRIDDVGQQEIAERAAEFAVATATGGIALASVPAEEREEALASMNLPAAEKEALRTDVEQARAQLVWLTLWDTHAEDGDFVLVASGGSRQTVPILHARTRIALPAPPSGVVNVTGVKDGGGGITIGILSGSSPVRVPFMQEGQTIGIPVSIAP